MNSVSWDLLLVAVLGILGTLFAVFGRKKPAIVPVPPGPSPVQKDQDKKEGEAEKKIEQAHDVVIVDITEKHDQEIATEAKDLEKKTETLEIDTKATNETLLDIGKQVRGGGA